MHEDMKSIFNFNCEQNKYMYIDISDNKTNNSINPL